MREDEGDERTRGGRGFTRNEDRNKRVPPPRYALVYFIFGTQSLLFTCPKETKELNLF